MKIDARVALLVEEAAQLQAKIDGLGLPRYDRTRLQLEYQLTKVRLIIRDLKTIQRATRPIGRQGKQLIPYAGADRERRR